MSFAVSTSRQVLRRSAPARFTLPRVRFESTANQTTAKAAETAKSAAGSAKATAESAAEKAAELQRKAAAQLAKASEYSERAAAGLAKAGASAQAYTQRLSTQGGRIGRIAGAINKQFPTVVYYTRVGIETAKIVFQAQKMSFPGIATFQAYGDSALTKLKNPSELVKLAQDLVQKARGGLSTSQIVSGTVIAVECLGFFTVGEMIGRWKIIGYRGKTPSHH